MVVNNRKQYRKTWQLFALITVAAILLSGVSAWAVSPDVPSAWAQADVDAARSQGLVIAEADHNYQANISRRLFCALVVNMVERALGQPVAVTVVNPFEDTDETEIIKAYQLGIVAGVSATRFAPDDFITREQITAMMMRSARKLDELEGSSYAVAADATPSTFADQNEISSWALEDIKTAYSLGLIYGVGANRIDPRGKTTVEQSILFISRLHNGFNTYLAGLDPTENRLPVARFDPVVFSVPEQIEIIISPSQLATDPDGDGLEIITVSGNFTNGTAELAANGRCRYISRDIATDETSEFLAEVSDGQSSIQVPIRINVIASTSANNQPVAISNPVGFAVQEQTGLTIAASQLAIDPDGDALRVIRVNDQTADYNSLHGTVSLTTDGKCLYTSNDITTNVADDFVVTVSDGINDTYVNIRVNVTYKLVLIIKPTITSVGVNGTAAMDETLRVGLISYGGGVPSPSPSLTYQWMRATSPTGAYTDIPGQTGSSYMIPQSDVGKYLKLKVTATGSATGSVTSAVKGPVGYGFAGGAGTEADPYQIATAKQFMLLNVVPTAGKYFALTADIELDQDAYITTTFYGALDGNRHMVTIDLQMPGETQYAGLFNATGKTTSALGKIMNLTVAGEIDSLISYAGGIVGHNSGRISQCLSSVDISAKAYVGGIAGTNSGIIERCGVVSDHVVGTNGMIGGIAGRNLTTGGVANSYVWADVFGSGNEGGLIGYNEGGVQYCYSMGHVDGYNNIGGLVGHNDGGTVQNSYYDQETSGQSDTGKGIPRATSQMKTASTYVAWDFTYIWSIAAGQYPTLRPE